MRIEINSLMKMVFCSLSREEMKKVFRALHAKERSFHLD